MFFKSTYFSTDEPPDSAYKKNPPADYFYPPIDIFAKLASIKSNLQANVYVNEYAFQQDLYQVFAPGHDGHYVLYPDLLTKAFEWGRARALVSISKDGNEIPEIYIYGESSLVHTEIELSLTNLRGHYCIPVNRFSAKTNQWN
jgi:hypothetical protein